LRFNRIQYLRRKDREEEAWKMLLDAPSEPNVLLDLNNWWVERRVNCRAALNAGKARIAYEIAAKHGLVSGDAYIEAEFLAGWIALRFLNEPDTALQHFVALRSAATSSKSIALGEYWLGRTALALGDRNAAIIHFHGAAKYPQYFYGQLGRQALDARPARLAVTSTPLPKDSDIQRFLSRDAVRAIGVARATGLDGATPQFFLALSRKLESPAEIVLLAELAKVLGQPQIALRLIQDRVQPRPPRRRLRTADRRHSGIQEPARAGPRRYRPGPCPVPPGERVQRRRQEPGGRKRPDAAHAEHGQGHRQSL
jgi:soluble lytic murein transglycosylase